MIRCFIPATRSRRHGSNPAGLSDSSPRRSPTGVGTRDTEGKRKGTRNEGRGKGSEPSGDTTHTIDGHRGPDRRHGAGGRGGGAACGLWAARGDDECARGSGFRRPTGAAAGGGAGAGRSHAVG